MRLVGIAWTRQMSTVHQLSHRLTVSSKLGGPNHHFLEPPKKPSRMRWRTYDCLVDHELLGEVTPLVERA